MQSESAVKLQSINDAFLDDFLNVEQFKKTIQDKLDEMRKRNFTLDEENEPGWCVTDCITAAPPYCG